MPSWSLRSAICGPSPTLNLTYSTGRDAAAYLPVFYKTFPDIVGVAIGRPRANTPFAPTVRVLGAASAIGNADGQVLLEKGEIYAILNAERGCYHQ